MYFSRLRVKTLRVTDLFMCHAVLGNVLGNSKSHFRVDPVHSNSFLIVD